jgi:hypothetical protein
MSPQKIPQNEIKRSRGFQLKYRDFKALERIIEDYNSDDNGVINFNEMKPDEKDILWKIKTIIRNMESVRLRVNSPEL